MRFVGLILCVGALCGMFMMSAYGAEASYLVRRNFLSSSHIFSSHAPLNVFHNKRYDYSFKYSRGMHIKSELSGRRVDVFDVNRRQGSLCTIIVRADETDDEFRRILQDSIATASVQGETPSVETLLIGEQLAQKIGHVGGVSLTTYAIPSARMIIINRARTGPEGMRFQELLSSLRFEEHPL